MILIHCSYWILDKLTWDKNIKILDLVLQKTSYTVFGCVNCETGNITYQLSNDGDYYMV